MSGALLDRVRRPATRRHGAPAPRYRGERTSACLLWPWPKSPANRLRLDAERIVRAFMATYQESGYFAGDLGLALMRLRDPAILIAIAGDPGDPRPWPSGRRPNAVTRLIIPLFIDVRANPELPARGIRTRPTRRPSSPGGTVRTPRRRVPPSSGRRRFECRAIDSASMRTS